jgi:hypothetical protein
LLLLVAIFVVSASQLTPPRRLVAAFLPCIVASFLPQAEVVPAISQPRFDFSVEYTASASLCGKMVLDSQAALLESII